MLTLTCLAEALGTSLLGGLAAYPVAKLLMHLNVAGTFVYVVPFFLSTAVGSALAFFVLAALKKCGILPHIPVIPGK